ncbi:MAG: hypothetical protein JWM90_2783 [Thermoleophilia bacterium]|nr:hypothetical protein [Thermoleophilia bacterium]
MSSIQRPAIIGGGPVATERRASETSDANSDANTLSENGIVVDRNPVLRTVLLTGGLGTLGAGAAMLGISRLPGPALAGILSAHGSRPLMFAGIGAAVAGAVSTAVGLTKGADNIPWLAKTEGTRQDALTQAAGFGRDIGVVQVDEDSWGLVDLGGEKIDIDGSGPDGFKMGTPPVQFAAFASELGDTYVPEGSGWKNLGAPVRTDVSDLTSADAAKLSGTQLGATGDGQRLTLGAVRTKGEAHATRADAIRTEFEQGTSNVAVVQLADGFVTYEIEGGTVERSAEARGTAVEPFGNVEFLMEDGVATFAKPGEATRATTMPMDEVSGIPLADASQLEGRRIGSGMVRLGSVIATGADTATVARSLFEQGSDHSVLVQLADGVAAFAISKSFEGFSTMLGPNAGLRQQYGADLHAADGTRGHIVTVDAANLPVASASSLVGQRFGMDGSSIVRIASVGQSYGSAAEANAAASTAGGNVYLVQLRDGVVRVQLDGAPDQLRTGIDPYSKLKLVNERLAFGTGGADWHFEQRSVPFQIDEPLGHDLAAGGTRGRAVRHLDSSSSTSGAWSRVEGDLYSDRRYAVVESDGPRGAAHLYELEGGGGSSWDERLGEVDGISERHTSFDSYYTTDEGSPGNETVYYTEERRTWRETRTDHGTRTTADTGIDRDTNVDWGRTSALRSQRAAVREEARRLEQERLQREEAERQRQAEEAAERAEEARRRAEEEANRPAPAPPVDPGGSDGNSDPGSGGSDYDPGSGGAGSDW